ncbi:MAG TPA: maltose alpha-D-glucosyltransferase [Acidimicrobiales bacterium]|nr:maltose alpha-D-glucosyltransferase [Acidimicrobiales bacterium]
MSPGSQFGLPEAPDWYKDAIIYELHVRAFADSDADGRGDFRGLAQRLDYLQQLGVTAIWLLPFYPSPLRDDGYDIADYTSIHPDYGTLADFRRFVEEAHRRDLKVITELVINHTSDQHPWFQRARRAPAGSSYRDYYVWSDTTDLYKDARVIFRDFETSNWAWDAEAGAYYWHRFYSHQPDLNFNNPAVHKAVLKALDFWLRLGVDGLRLDAVPYLYERDGTDCENLPETHAFLKMLRRHMDEHYPGRMLLAEANQWPDDASAYFGKGDECHMAFHFPVMPRLFMGLRMEDRFPIIDIMQQTPDIPANCQWAVFLRNHDELTLEMVTDEERDYMYRSYASDPVMRVNLGIRRRLAPLLQFHRQKIELMHGLLMSLPGTPVLYYGDEIGMGDNVYLGDRNSVRTPMQWNADRNAGFSTANPQRLFLPVNTDPQCHYESVNVEAQSDNPDSLLRWIRRLIALRKRHPVFGRGRMEFVQSDNPRVLSFIRGDGHEEVLVVANLSRFAQYVELDLAAHRGVTPRELFGQTTFPMIGELPYLVTLGPHSFYWLSLGDPTADAHTGTVSLPALQTAGPWWRLAETQERRKLEAMLPAVLRSRRWFGGKGRRIAQATIVDYVYLPLQSASADRAQLLVVNVDYLESEPERYLLPVTFVQGEAADALVRDHPEGVFTIITSGGPPGLLIDAHYEPAFGKALIGLLRNRRRRDESGAHLVASTVPQTAALLARVPTGVRSSARVVSQEQSNSSIIIGDAEDHRCIVKSLRRLEAGIHPEIELGRLLAAAGPSAGAARLLGAVDLVDEDGRASLVASVHEYVPHESDAWTSTLRSAGSFLETCVPAFTGVSEQPLPPPRLGGFLDGVAAGSIPESVEALMSDQLATADLLGRRTAELHIALTGRGIGATVPGDFVPELVTPMSQRSLYQSMRTAARRTLVLVRQRMRAMSARDQALAREILECEDEMLEAFLAVLDVRRAKRIRVHGDLHLGQVLFTGRDYVFVDFEGEPERSLGERRLKRSPMRDIAGMLRSYQYAAYSAVDDLISRGVLEPESSIELEHYQRAATRWAYWTSIAYLGGYLPTAREAELLPSDSELAIDLRAHLLEKALYELRYELGNRPDWAHIPLLGLQWLLALDREARSP